MAQLYQLFALNRSANRRFEVVTNEANTEATLYLYDMIVSTDNEAEWWGGVSPMNFIKELSNITASTIHLRINSPGGDVFAARCMEQAIVESGKTVIAHIDGLCASAATYIALACSSVAMGEGSLFMIHNAWTMAWGDKNDLTKTATLLNKIDGTLANSYAKKTGKETSEIAALMDAETWFTAQEALDYGFVDEVSTNETPKNTAQQAKNWQLGVYKNAPKLNSEPNKPTQQPQNTQKPTSKPAVFDKQQALNRLNLACI
ncbi:head maturation protease, ClpP-related [uncultured Agitococcus sp.]|uniref:head maturation protease, ClpP-related n=1 Tax=uncultured Agitococcus sp. TaxID=1506599 RepID=UPI00260B04D0|nr:head maturation protease, ClpP-related [uncultured Agitococcus sp.]